MYRWFNSKGEMVKTKTIPEFAKRYNFPASMARSLACGYRIRLRGWISGSSKPRIKKARKRFLMKLVNTWTGEKCVLGPSIAKFAAQHGLSRAGLNELIIGRVPIYRGWMLESTGQLLSS